MIINNYFNSDFSTLAIYLLRYHHYKGISVQTFQTSLKIKLLIKIFFDRLTNDWNALPPFVVSTNSVNNLKSLLDKCTKKLG